MNRNALLRCFAGLASGLLMVAEASANSWTCLQDGLTREVTVYYPNEPARLPCDVYYSKRDENMMPRPIWTAFSEEGYCERKAEAFVEKLQSLGWQCDADTDPRATGESAASKAQE